VGAIGERGLFCDRKRVGGKWGKWSHHRNCAKCQARVDRGTSKEGKNSGCRLGGAGRA